MVVVKIVVLLSKVIYRVQSATPKMCGYKVQIICVSVVVKLGKKSNKCVMFARKTRVLGRLTRRSSRPIHRRYIFSGII